MSEHNYILGFQDEHGEFDVFAYVRNNTTKPSDRIIALFLSQESIRALIKEMLQDGTIAKDAEGKYYLPERKQL